jgi:hypothetical protein
MPVSSLDASRHLNMKPSWWPPPCCFISLQRCPCLQVAAGIRHVACLFAALHAPWSHHLFSRFWDKGSYFGQAFANIALGSHVTRRTNNQIDRAPYRRRRTVHPTPGTCPARRREPCQRKKYQKPPAPTEPAKPPGQEKQGVKQSTLRRCQPSTLNRDRPPGLEARQAKHHADAAAPVPESRANRQDRQRGR